MDWETLIGSCGSLKELENFFDLWAPIPQEFVELAHEKLCELSMDNFDQTAFDSLSFYYPELFVDNIPVSAFLFFYFYYHSLSVFRDLPPLPPIPCLLHSFPIIHNIELFSRLNSGLTLKFCSN